jgi:hypothetical protein
MTFPSIWALIGVVIGFFIVLMLVAGGLQAILVKGDKSDLALQERGREVQNAALELGGYWFPPLAFWALTGSFPLTFTLIATLLFAITGIISVLIVRTSGIRKDREEGDSLILSHVFVFNRIVRWSLVSFVLLMAFYLFLAFAGYNAARTADLSDPDGLFHVAMYVFFAPSAAFFVLTWPYTVFILGSLQTPRQVRVEQFARSLRLFVIGIWGLLYPFFGFRQDILQENVSWLYLAAIAVLAAYLLTAIAPYELGRRGFARAERELLERMRDDVQALIVATETGVSESFRDKVFADTEQQLDKRFARLCKKNPECRNVALAWLPAAAAAAHVGGPHYRVFVEEVRRDGLALSDQLQGYRYRLPILDYRLLALNEVQMLLSRIKDAAWVRGVALLADRTIQRRLERRESRSALIAAIGITLATLVPIVKSEFEPEIRAVFRAGLGYVSAIDLTPAR